VLSGAKRHVSIDKETGNAVGDALSVANRWEVAQKGSQENAFVTLGYVGSRLVYEIAVYEFKIGREKPLIISVGHPCQPPAPRQTLRMTVLS
jgi:hypothetical protein